MLNTSLSNYAFIFSRAVVASVNEILYKKTFWQLPGHAFYILYLFLNGSDRD